MQKENRFYLNELFELYKPLLTKKQTLYYIDYYFYDYTLSEIAEHFNVSRTVVHNTLKLITSELISYEKKMNLYKNKITRLNLYEKISDYNLKLKLQNLEIGNKHDEK